MREAVAADRCMQCVHHGPARAQPTVTADRPDEAAARHIVSAVLGVPVVAYDNGSRASMVDAIIKHKHGDAPLEVVADRDPAFSALWDALEKRGHQVQFEHLNRAWNVQLRHTASVKRCVAALRGLLVSMEDAGLSDLRHTHRQPFWPLSHLADELGIQMAYAIEHRPPGHVSLHSQGFSGSAGTVDLAAWTENMLDVHADVPRKLAAHGSTSGEGHTFFWATISTSYTVQSDLEDRGQALWQPRPPELPDGVTHVWIAGSFNSQGVLAWFPDRGWWRTPFMWPDGPLVLGDA
jgi:hypothetical protein